jgi:hypothetical protein
MAIAAMKPNESAVISTYNLLTRSIVASFAGGPAFRSSNPEFVVTPCGSVNATVRMKTNAKIIAARES